jgi:hypothetical protein
VVELDDGHDDEGDQKMIKCFTIRKEEREKTKMGSRLRYM